MAEMADTVYTAPTVCKYRIGIRYMDGMLKPIIAGNPPSLLTQMVWYVCPGIILLVWFLLLSTYCIDIPDAPDGESRCNDSTYSDRPAPPQWRDERQQDF